MRFEYVPGNTFLHRLDVRTKLLGVAVVVAMTVLLPTPGAQVLLAVGSLALVLLLHVPAKQIVSMFAPLSFVIAMIVVFASLWPPSGRRGGEVLLHLWFDGALPLTTTGLAWGATLGLRIVTMVAITSVLVLSTPIEDLVALMQKARLPFPLVFIVMTALRFVPTLQARSAQILDAQRARGVKVDDRGMIGAIRAHISIMVPLFSTSIRMSEDLAAAMLSRGYGVTKRPTSLVELRGSWRDAVVVAILVVVLATTIVLRVTGMGTS
ncbi:energy-coupling factor transporter transmembrane component T family protein [Tessaracoccus caeni]|uniref:energy-coupling factor transporter transmembrane component T family protein n=1 Tax=Tessaracoccus caeni TaxID=3031239 RepID=UPI0023DA5EE9|nr:energy-coupling factor transporter transmembrane component T [Tessaracoccus caeni]MDF1488712.1 energy-coupling factor transporter transmembrane component T [Tessaracoccus caeni]